MLYGACELTPQIDMPPKTTIMCVTCHSQVSPSRAACRLNMRLFQSGSWMKRMFSILKSAWRAFHSTAQARLPQLGDFHLIGRWKQDPEGYGGIGHRAISWASPSICGRDSFLAM